MNVDKMTDDRSGERKNAERKLHTLRCTTYAVESNNRSFTSSDPERRLTVLQNTYSRHGCIRLRSGFALKRGYVGKGI